MSGTCRGRTLLALILALIAAPAASAQGAPEGSGDAELRREVEALKRKVEALEKASAAGGGAAAGAAASDEDELRKLQEDAADEAERAPPKPGAPGAAPGAGQPSAGGPQGGLVQSLNAFNPRMTAFGDFVGRAGLDGAELEEDDRVSIRSAELDLRADVDPYAKAVFVLAVEEEEPGEYVIHAEEAYVTLETLPWNFRGQIGRWKQRFGQVNRTHQHDLMWVDYPLALRDFLGDEGLIENAVSLQWLAPGLPLEVEAAALNGENATILAGADSDFPALLGRMQAFGALPQRMSVTAGTSYFLGYNDAQNDAVSQLLGGDFLFQWRPSQFHSVSALGELYYLQRENLAGRGDYALGGYAALQVQPRQQLHVGARYDWSDYAEQIEDNTQWAGSVYASWYTTEFLRFRAGYEHRERRSTGFPGAGPDLDTLFLQVTFVFGSHPVEPFWVNR